MSRVVDYIERLRAERRISDTVADATRRAYTMAPTLPMPNAGDGPSGEMILSWNIGPHHLEVEIEPSGEAEWFYLNFQTNETWLQAQPPSPEQAEPLQEAAHRP